MWCDPDIGWAAGVTLLVAVVVVCGGDEDGGDDGEDGDDDDNDDCNSGDGVGCNANDEEHYLTVRR